MCAHDCHMIECTALDYCTKMFLISDRNSQSVGSRDCTSLVSRRLKERGRDAWYHLFACAFNLPATLCLHLCSNDSSIAQVIRVSAVINGHLNKWLWLKFRQIVFLRVRDLYKDVIKHTLK